MVLTLFLLLRLLLRVLIVLWRDDIVLGSRIWALVFRIVLGMILNTKLVFKNKLKCCLFKINLLCAGFCWPF